MLGVVLARDGEHGKDDMAFTLHVMMYSAYSQTRRIRIRIHG